MRATDSARSTRRAAIGAAVAGLLGACCAFAQSHPAGTADRAATETRRSVTVPFTLDHNRMLVEVAFVRPDGSLRPARAWVDTGSPDLMLAEPLARDLGLAAPAPDGAAATIPPPPLRLDGLPLDTDGVRVKLRAGAVVLPGVDAEASLPASALRRMHVVFDYPSRLLTVAHPGVLSPRGTGVPCRVNPQTGLFMLPALADGDTVQLGIDTGSAGTWVSDALTTRWRARHPDWRQATGAAGSANFFGFPFETGGLLMRLPALEIAGLPVRDVALLGLDQSLFDWYSAKSAAPVAGFIGANVLRQFRLEVDFPREMTYWEPRPAASPPDLDIVGLTLRPEPDGTLTIAAVVTTDGAPAVAGIEPGDKLLRVDQLDVAHATMGEAINALRGPPGAIRTLTIERGGSQLTIEAKVSRLP